MSCDCGRWYIGHTSRPLTAPIKEHKYSVMQGLLKSDNNFSVHMKEATNVLERSEGLAH
jgi:hypothetical protein